MELRKIRFEKVYGHLSGTLSFKRGENFIVGINGCGKTTVLNLIRWLLEPSLPDLCTLEHDLVRLDILHNGQLYSIESKMLKDKHRLKVVTRDNSRTFKPIATSLYMHPRAARDQGMISELKEAYQGLQPEPHEVSTWTFLLKELPTPVFVGLERGFRERPTSRVRHKSAHPPGPVDGPAPISRARAIMRDAFNTSRQKLVDINEELNRNVLELSFSGFLAPRPPTTERRTQEIAQKISRLKKRFMDSSASGAYSKALSSQGVRDAVVKYLEDLESLTNRKQNFDPLFLLLNQHNFDRASKMFDLFENHEKRAQDAHKEIDAFCSAVNLFLTDSGKRVAFDQNTGDPFFKTASSNANLSISELSSGEAQIVILLSYLAFLAKTGTPVVIDEPELSLHVEWQKHFVEAVQKVMPSECQAIMATHSPEICGASGVNVLPLPIRGLR